MCLINNTHVENESELNFTQYLIFLFGHYIIQLILQLLLFSSRALLLQSIHHKGQMGQKGQGPKRPKGLRAKGPTKWAKGKGSWNNMTKGQKSREAFDPWLFGICDLAICLFVPFRPFTPCNLARLALWVFWPLDR